MYIPAPLQRTPMKAGDLAKESLLDVLLQLSQMEVNGTLVLTSPEFGKARIKFHEGQMTLVPRRFFGNLEIEYLLKVNLGSYAFFKSIPKVKVLRPEISFIDISEENPELKVA